MDVFDFLYIDRGQNSNDPIHSINSSLLNQDHGKVQYRKFNYNNDQEH